MTRIIIEMDLADDPHFEMGAVLAIETLEGGAAIQRFRQMEVVRIEVQPDRNVVIYEFARPAPPKTLGEQLMRVVATARSGELPVGGFQGNKAYWLTEEGANMTLSEVGQKNLGAALERALDNERSCCTQVAEARKALNNAMADLVRWRKAVDDLTVDLGGARQHWPEV